MLQILSITSIEQGDMMYKLAKFLYCSVGLSGFRQFWFFVQNSIPLTFQAKMGIFAIFWVRPTFSGMKNIGSTHCWWPCSVLRFRFELFYYFGMVMFDKIENWMHQPFLNKKIHFFLYFESPLTGASKESLLILRIWCFFTKFEFRVW